MARTTNSLFRIDRNAIGNGQAEPKVCVLPSLEQILPKSKAPQDSAESEEEPEAPGLTAEEREIAERTKNAEDQLADLSAQLDKATADIEAAKAEAAAIRDQAAKDAVQVREQARQEGYAAGTAEAKKEYDVVLQREKKEFAKSVQTLAGAKHEVAEEMEPAVLDLAMFCAEKIINASLDRGDPLFVNIIRNTIKEVEECEEIVLRVNKKEYDRFFADDKEEYTNLLKSSGVRIRPDMSVESGECIVETEFGTLRSGIRTQLERMQKALEAADGYATD